MTTPIDMMKTRQMAESATERGGICEIHRDQLLWLLDEVIDKTSDVVRLQHEGDTLQSIVDELEEQIDGLTSLVKVTPTRLRAVDEYSRQVQAENVALRAAQDKLVAWAKSCAVETADGGKSFVLNVWHCTWCGEGGPAVEGDSGDAKAHDRVCASNPWAVEAAKLRAEVTSLQSDLRCANIQVADRGQSYADAKSDNDKLRAALVESCDLVAAVAGDAPYSSHGQRIAELRQLAEAK